MGYPRRRTEPHGAPVPAALRRRGSPWAFGVLLTGLIVTAGVTGWGWHGARSAEQEQLAEAGSVLVFDTKGVLADVAAQVEAVGGLFRASDRVELDEFRRFTGDIGPFPGVLGLGYAPVVPEETLDGFVDHTAKLSPGLEYHEIGPPDQVLAPGRPIRYPLLFFEPRDTFRGMVGADLGSVPGWYAGLEASRLSGGWTMTGLADLGRPAPADDGDQFLIASPIRSVGLGYVEGVAVAVVDLHMLIDGNIPPTVSNRLDWTVTDITDGGGEAVGTWSSDLEFGGRIWRFAVSDPAIAGSWRGSEVWVPLTAGIIITLLLSVVVSLTEAAARERRRTSSLEALNIAKDEFLASVSHRLRTPLTAVVGFAEVLKDGGRGLNESDRRELLSTIAVEALELGHLFDNLLTVAREQDYAAFAPSRVVVLDEIHEVLDTMEPAIRVRVAVAPSDSGIVADGDRALVYQIIRNLVTNAATYGDSAEIQVVGEVDRVKILVRDDGPGIPAERAAAIFDLYQHDGDPVGQPQSMGVGLYVSRKLARRMGGDVVYRRVGGNTVFELTLPSAPRPVVAQGSR
jgi:signal transduction histidine kinase